MYRMRHIRVTCVAWRLRASRFNLLALVAATRRGTRKRTEFTPCMQYDVDDSAGDAWLECDCFRGLLILNRHEYGGCR